MGVFPHFFGGGPLKQLTNVVLPGLPLLTQSIKSVTPLVKTGIQELHDVGSHQTTPQAAQPVGVYPGNYPAMYQNPTPMVPPPQYYQSPFAPPPYQFTPTPDTFSPYGGPSWDSSIPSPAYYPPPSPTYLPVQTMPSAGDRTWEDLISLAPLIL